MTARSEPSSFDLEGTVSTLTVLRLQSVEVDTITEQLRDKIRQMPGFFAQAPVIIDPSLVEGTDSEDEEGDDDEVPRERAVVPLTALVAALRELNLIPVGVRNLREARRADAAEAGLGVLRGSQRSKPVEAEESSTEDAQGEPKQAGSEAAPAAVQELPGHPPALTLRTPLRGGQVVYAEQADAVVLASVNSGAELIADGNIHIYGALRGRALAGAHGNKEARIFCRSLEADLVSIAGQYLRADELPEEFRGKPAQIALVEDKLVVSAL